jgi:RNA polymerase sigma-70 factor (ECF subfamily)
MDDRVFIESIRQGGNLMQKSIGWFYHENFNLVYQKVRLNQLDKDQAIDAYADAMTAFVENIRENKFRGESRCSTYFIRIFNNKCVDLLRKITTNRIERNSISLEEFKQDILEPEDGIDEEEPEVGSFLIQLSGICRNLLMDWSEGYSMEEIASRNGLKNAHTARSKRYNCFLQFMDILRRNNMLKESLKAQDHGD